MRVLSPVAGLFVLLASASTCFGGLSLNLDRTLTTINPADWYGPTPAGSIVAGANGITTASSGSLIAKAIPSGPQQGAARGDEYEIRTTYKLLVSGGSYVTHFRATPNAWLNPAGASSGSFYALELRNVVVQPSGACETDMRVVKSLNGVLTELSSGRVPCWNGMVLRTVVRDYVIYIFKEQWDGCCFYVPDRDLMTGQPGVGVANTPAGNGITQVQLAYADSTAPPVPARPGVSAFEKRVDMQWPGSGDNDPGTGLYYYRLWRRTLPLTPRTTWNYLGQIRTPNFTDQTGLLPSTQYEYWWTL